MSWLLGISAFWLVLPPGVLGIPGFLPSTASKLISGIRIFTIGLIVFILITNVTVLGFVCITNIYQFSVSLLTMVKLSLHFYSCDCCCCNFVYSCYCCQYSKLGLFL